jgi:hypothetical protein
MPKSPADAARSGLPIRASLTATHREMLASFSRSGTWWTGAERRAIVTEARAAWECPLCVQRKAALSPFSLEGDHRGPSRLAPRIVDVIHRIVTDPGRLTRSWYERVVAEGVLSEECYVELVSVAVQSNALDVFAQAIGAESPEIPAEAPGAPTKQRPASARIEGAWVPQIPSGDAGGEDWKALYGEREGVPQIGRALSLVPAEVDALNAISTSHYMAIDHVIDPSYTEPGRSLDRLQMELVASRVSALNECFY